MVRKDRGFVCEKCWISRADTPEEALQCGEWFAKREEDYPRIFRGRSAEVSVSPGKKVGGSGHAADPSSPQQSAEACSAAPSAADIALG